MSKLNRHIIGKQIFDLTIPSGKDSFAFQQKVSKISNGGLKEALEQLFDRYSDEETLIRIENLTVDLGNVFWDQVDEVFIEEIIKEIELTITEKITLANEQENIIAIQQARFRYWISFLESGYFTWEVSTFTEKELFQSVLEAIENNEVAENELKQLLASQPTTLERLLKQHPEDFIKTIFQKMSGLSLNWMDEFKAELIQFFSLLTKYKTIYNQYIKVPSYGIKRRIELIFWKSLSENIINKKITNESLLKELILENAVLEVIKSEALPSFFKSSKKILKLLRKRMGLDLVEVSLTTLIEKYKIKEVPDSQKESKEKKLGSASKEKQNVNKIKADKKKDLKSNKVTNKQNDDHSEKEKSTRSIEPRVNKVKQEQNVEADNDIFLEGLDEVLYLKNAGVILLHPFLSAYFRELELVKKDKFVDQAAQEKAVHLIQFLATGETNLPEYELLLPKFLCGLASNATIDRTILISDKEKKEGEGLLEAAIQHWGALGEVSPDGLREGFLLRAGKLEKRNAGWYLQVEQKTIDILLNKLPWNLSMIQLPWMKEILRVEWA